MKLGFDLNIEQMQKLVMTPELIQAIQILQFNTHELETYVEEQLLTNPILENSPSQSGDEGSDKPDYDEDLSLKKDDIDWKEYIKQFDDISYRQIEHREESKENSYEQFVSKGITLTEHLMLQLQFCIEDKDVIKIARYIIESLDSNGYMTLSDKEIIQKFNTSEELYNRALELVQNFDPNGVGARDLSECLLIQLRQTQITDENLFTIIRNHLNDIADNKLNNIAKCLNIAVEEVQKYADIIKKMEPKPGRKFEASGDEIKYIVADVTVEKIDGKYIVHVNDSTAPRLNINAQYKSMLLNADSESNVSQYLTNKLNAAMWLIKSIEQRRQTIYNVVNAIVEMQHDYFEKGKKYLLPLTLKQVADEIGVHESTVSRAIHGKYLQCCKGITEIKYFFSSGISCGQGQGMSSQSIKTMLKELIDEENVKKPYSDQDLTDILNEKDIDISRRTVAKYREELNIPSSSKRRRY